MTKLEEADVLIRHHLKDFDEYLEEGYYLAAVLSLWDIHGILRESRPEDLQDLVTRWWPEIERRGKKADRFPSRDKAHDLPPAPFFGLKSA